MAQLLRHHGERTHLDHAGSHIPVGEQPGFHLPGLHPHAAQLHLTVLAAEKLHDAVLAPAREIAAAVHAATRPERIGEEPFGGEVRSAEIALPDAVAADEQLTGDTGRQRLPGST